MINPKVLKILSASPYSVKGDVVYMIEGGGKSFTEKSPDVLINKLKVFFKKYPAVFRILHYAFGVSRVGKSAKEAIKDLGEDKIILNLGSGTDVKRKDVINVDFYPFANVDVVADIAKLPFKDESVDGIICEFVLEHVRNPRGVLQEIKRVLKSGGLVYITIPFIASFHSSPEDYYRWSREGIVAVMREQGFKQKEAGVRYGPTSALLSVMNNWLAIIFSFGSGGLQQLISMFLIVITSPLKIIDYLIYRLRTSQNIAYGFYYLGEKE